MMGINTNFLVFKWLNIILKEKKKMSSLIGIIFLLNDIQLLGAAEQAGSLTPSNGISLPDPRYIPCHIHWYLVL